MDLDLSEMARRCTVSQSENRNAEGGGGSHVCCGEELSSRPWGTDLVLPKGQTGAAGGRQ